MFLCCTDDAVAGSSLDISHNAYTGSFPGDASSLSLLSLDASWNALTSLVDDFSCTCARVRHATGHFVLRGADVPRIKMSLASMSRSCWQGVA